MASKVGHYPLKQVEIARRAGVSQCEVSLALNGKRKLRFETAVAIARVLGIPAEVLLGRDRLAIRGAIWEQVALGRFKAENLAALPDIEAGIL